MNGTSPASRLIAFATLALCTAHVVGAQLLRGVVRDSTSHQLVPGVVVVLLNADARVLGRNITNEDGQYEIALTAAMTRMRLLRIGFQPRDIAIPAVATGAQELDVAMVSIPTLLSAISVVDEATCPRRDDGPAAFALWEQAKAALLATVVTREANPADVVRLHFDRRLDERDRVVSQAVRIDSASTARPWVASRSAARFVEDGFAVDSAHARWFAGPDADVMIDDAFARGYCFGIAAPDSSRPHEIGLAFTRAIRKRGHVDIEGIVWLDSVSRSLSEIDFDYVGLDGRSTRLRPGGRIEFRVMQTGAPMVARWALRFPTAKPGPFDRAAGPALEARESGGEVARVRWRNGRAWQASLGTLRGSVEGDGAAGTLIRLLGTDYSAVADSAGLFEISNLLPGPYSVGATTGQLAALGTTVDTLDGFTAARDSVVRLTPTVPSAAAYIAGRCDATSPGFGVVIARVLMPGGDAAEGARVEVRAITDGSFQRVAEGKADSNGLFFACQAPRGTQLQIVAEHDGATASAIAMLTTRITVARMQLKP